VHAVGGSASQASDARCDRRYLQGKKAAKPCWPVCIGRVVGSASHKLCVLCKVCAVQCACSAGHSTGEHRAERAERGARTSSTEQSSCVSKQVGCIAFWNGLMRPMLKMMYAVGLFCGGGGGMQGLVSSLRTALPPSIHDGNGGSKTTQQPYTAAARCQTAAAIFSAAAKIRLGALPLTFAKHAQAGHRPGRPPADGIQQEVALLRAVCACAWADGVGECVDAEGGGCRCCSLGPALPLCTHH